jgi:hypothetical protein
MTLITSGNQIRHLSNQGAYEMYIEFKERQESIVTFANRWGVSCYSIKSIFDRVEQHKERFKELFGK